MGKIPKHEHLFNKLGLCECGIYKGLNKRKSVRYAIGEDCFSIEVFDAEWEALHRLHLFAMGKGKRIKKWFDLEVKAKKWVYG